ncbi:MAG TPA: hypothetical protein VLJ76_11275 [Gaiellaceae bacterium]|nr:hypothetical protein [Gaiellaceae bacterium]
MKQARRHQRLCSAFAFGLLAIVAEFVGASLTHRIDLGRHVKSPGYSHAAWYPAVVATVKVGIALLLASLLWRMLRAHAIERAARRVAGAVGGELPRVRLGLSPRLALAFFVVTSIAFLVHADVTRLEGGRWALFFPLVHSSALPFFAVLAVIVSVLWSVVQRWLADYEQYVENAARFARSLSRARPVRVPFPHVVLVVPPRRLFGFVLDSRPPPAAA